MPTVLGEVFAPDYSHLPPGMSMLDSVLWQAFRKEHYQEWTRVFYNCRLGGTDILPGQYCMEDTQLWHRLTAPRVDAIVETEKEIYIIEVRPNAKRDAFGACLLYIELYSQDPILKKPCRSVIVTNFMSTTMKMTYHNAGITVYIVPPDTHPEAQNELSPEKA